MPPRCASKSNIVEQHLVLLSAATDRVNATSFSVGSLRFASRVRAALFIGGIPRNSVDSRRAERPLWIDFVENLVVGMNWRPRRRCVRYQLWPILAGQAGSGNFSGLSLASFLRFWAAAARWNSSRAPFGPRSRKPIQLQDALEVGEQQLDLLALPPRGPAFLGSGDVARHLARALVDRA